MTAMPTPCRHALWARMQADVCRACRLVPQYAFYDCTSLTSVSFQGSAVTSIGQFAFSGCTSLVSLELGDSLTTIGNVSHCEP